MTMCSHMHNTLAQCTRLWVDVICKLEAMQFVIRVKVANISNKPPLVVQHVFPLTGSVGFSAYAGVWKYYARLVRHGPISFRTS